jgi:TldD protein
VPEPAIVETPRAALGGRVAARRKVADQDPVAPAAPSVIGELEGLTPLAAELSRRAGATGVTAIWRAQARRVRRVLVREGRTEETSSSSISGQGIQVFTEQGHTALGSRDDFDPEAALTLLDRVTAVAHKAPALGTSPAELPSLPEVRGRAVPDNVPAFDRIDLAQLSRRLAELESELCGQVPGVGLRISFQADLDAWRIVRSDGTDVLFAMPRCVLHLAATASGSGATHTVGASVSGPDPGLPWDASKIELFLLRAARAARLARELPDAPTHTAGSFPLIIDYALAKGLAHEAFGHASEADAFRSSILAADGRFKQGHRVGPDHVSIIDEPLEGDHAWQPFSANGLRRERAVIVDHGKLCDALADPWSAGPGGVRVTGSARASSYRTPPLPRMSNIRIEVDDPLPAEGRFEDYGPERVRELVASAGVFDRHPEVVFLSGYSGGQVNVATGDFVFNCKALYGLSHHGVRLHKPAIFSGSMFGALASIREAFGPLVLDALGTCGKWGQSVPSSGGSHYFLVLDPDPSVRLGGHS